MRHDFNAHALTNMMHAPTGFEYGREGGKEGGKEGGRKAAGCV